MSATVIGTIESAKIAQKAIDELLKAGFKDQDVEILEGDEDEIVAEIVERGFDEDDARGYAKAVSRGKTVLAARAPRPRPRRLPPSSSATRPHRRELAAGAGRDRVRDRGGTLGRQEQGRQRRGPGDHPRQRAAGRGDRHLA